jgi:signal transduction histidine kinase
MPGQRRLRSRLLAALFVGVCAVVPARGQAADQQPSVLILLPGQFGLPAATLIANGIRSSLLNEWSTRVAIETEYVDFARFSTPEAEERRLYAQYSSKEWTRKFNLIITASVSPLRFALGARDRLWPGVPVIGAAVDDRMIAGLDPSPGVTFVTTRFDMDGTLNAALSLLPDTRRVALVGGAGAPERPLHRLARQAVAERGLELDDLTSLSMADLLARVSRLPEHTAVLVSGYEMDGAGRRFYGLDVVGPLTQRANRPAFTLFNQALGRGIVGGSMTDFEALGREAGALAVRVLGGETPSTSRLQSGVVSVPRFDGRELARWRLDERRLPSGSEVLFRRPSLWSEYRWHVIGVVGLIAAQAGLIAALLVQRRQRRAAQALIAESTRLERLSAQIAAACADTPASKLDERIEECLARVVTFLGVDRGELWQSGRNESVVSLTHLSGTDGRLPLPPSLDLRFFPYLRKLMASDQDGLIVSRLDDLPADATSERATLERYGVRSVVAVALHSADRWRGFLAFVSLQTERAWPDTVLRDLKVLGEHFAHALVRVQSEGHAAFTTAVMAALPEEMAILDASGTILRTNAAWAHAAEMASVEVQRSLAVGANYLDACQNGLGMPEDTGRSFHASLDGLLQGVRDEVILEYRISGDGDRDQWFELRARRVRDFDPRIVVMRFDVSGRRRAEASARRHLSELAHLDRVASMGQLTASIAHELNQPLTAILSNAQAAARMLASPQPDLEELRACLADIVSDDQRAASVLQRMRRLLKRTDFATLPLAVNDLIANTIGLVSNDALLHRVTIKFVPAAALPIVYADLVQIQQVILNLLTNAITAAGNGRSPARLVRVWTTSAVTPYVEIAIHDSGAGIAEDDLQRVFDPFFSTKPDGLGMGLAISRTIVEAHGGHLTAENDPEGGATFRMRLRTDRSHVM